MFFFKFYDLIIYICIVVYCNYNKLKSFLNSKLMKYRFTLNLVFFIVFSLLSYQKTFSQCFEIESILVDACDTGADEGFNEMVRFKVGNAAINTSSLSVNWPSNSWTGLLQNATTISKVATLNAQIISAGGCGRLIEPVGGVLPANSKVILVSSYNFSVALNAFGAITENIYIIFQNNPAVTAGHFGNYNATPATRSLSMSFTGCSDSVTYERSLLVNTSGTYGGNLAVNNGATVNFTPSGIPTYVNRSCVAPVEIFSVDAGNSPISACAGATVSLLGTAQGQQSVLWTASSGSFSSAGSLTTNYTISPSATGSITIILKVTNSCSVDKTDTVTVNVISGTTPTFTTVSPICSGGSLSALPTTSNNSITGIWSPALDNTTTKTYTFTPTVGQCATTTTLTVTVKSGIDFEIKGNCVNGSYIIESKALSNSYNSTTASYQWQDNLGNNIGSNEATLNVSSLLASTSVVEEFPITYNLIVTSSDGCTKTNNSIVYGSFCAIPKGISPDGDSKNDEFDLTGLGVKELHIFNRYGTEVYNFTNYTKEWHGQSNGGDELPDGTYFYSIHKVDGTSATGWVYINRKQ